MFQPPLTLPSDEKPSGCFPDRPVPLSYRDGNQRPHPLMYKGLDGHFFNREKAVPEFPSDVKRIRLQFRQKGCCRMRWKPTAQRFRRATSLKIRTFAALICLNVSRPRVPRRSRRACGCVRGGRNGPGVHCGQNVQSLQLFGYATEAAEVAPVVDTGRETVVVAAGS